MANLYLPGAAVIISIILLVVYFSKERIKIKENEIYQIMLFCILFDSIFVTTIYANAGEGENLKLIKFLNRCDYDMLMMWSACLCSYTNTVLCKHDEKFRNKMKIGRRAMVATTIVECVTMWFLRLDAILENGIAKTITGPAVYFTFACCGLNLSLTLLVIVLKLKKISKQVIPVFSFLGIAGVCAFTFYFDPNISGVSMGLAIVNLTMYFTIENPDVQMLEKVNMAMQQAQRANQAKTDFLSGMSHEIRTPINAITGLAECIRNDETLEQAKNDADDILSASENLLEIVNGILDISKIEAGRMEVVNKEYNLVDMSKKLAKLIQTRIGEKPIALNLIFSDKIPGTLYGDETKLRQIMTNLLTNAAKYTESGKIDFVIDCENVDDTANLTISVTDTGHGIKPEAINSLFDKFKRLEEDKNSNIEGTGLGLAITKQFVEMLNGSIEVQSEYGKGSTFTVCVPQVIRSFDAKTEETQTEIRSEYPGHKVLVVDDIAINQMVAKRMLEVYKVDADTASSGEECIELCRTRAYDLVFLDDMMPNMSGTETLAKLKEDASFTTPVIAFTANAIDGMREMYVNNGYTDYLSKPIDKEALIHALECYLK